MLGQAYENEPPLKLGPCTIAYMLPFQKVCLSNVGCTSFMCLTLISIYIDHWKSFMKFGIKKSHEMISYILIGMTLLSAWIALLSEGKCRSSTKPCNLTQMTLDELYNKSHEGFVLSGGQENTSIGLKLGFKLYRDATLTCVDQSLIVLAWSCTLNQS